MSLSTNHIIIKIRVERLPLHFLILGGFLDIYATFNLLTAQSVIFNSILLLVGFLLLTSHQRLDIYLSKKLYSEYYWVLGMKLSNYSEPYQAITSVVCATRNYSQQYGKYNRRFISGIMYTGYIELKDQEHLFVGQNKSKTAMMKNLSKISAQLEVPLDDRVEEG